MKKRVLFVIDTKVTFSEAPPSRLLYIAKSLKRKNFNVEVLGRSGDRINFLNTHQISGTKHVSRLKIIIHVYAKILKRSYGVLIIRGGILSFFLLPTRLLKTKVILDFHGWLHREIEIFYEKTWYNKLKAAFYRIIERMSVRYSNKIICVSRGVRDSLGEREKIKSIVLENGIDLEESKRVICEAEKKGTIHPIQSILKEKPVIGFLGNWERQLDMETMFQGAKLAGVNMVVIGEGPRLSEFKKIWRNIKFLGKLPRYEALKIIYLCDAVITPYKKAYAILSYWSQRKVKDYLSLGKPILMADVLEREEFLVPYKNAVFYCPNDPNDLAAKIRMIISDEKLRKRMRRNNLKLARQFDWQVLVEKSGLIEELSKL
jgi:glycosyltransferase involved in cell wall biosynthesis